MTGARRRALLFVSLVLAVGAVFAIAAIQRNAGSLAPRPPSQRPTLLLLTSLPLVFGEDFSLEGGGSPALRRLESSYQVIPISVTDRADLAKGELLLMAQPRAQTAENLVTLDEWVRSGGRVLLLADPMLEWPSKRPLGDPLRPSPMFADTGLLQHWGLRLDAPDRRGPAERRLGSHQVATTSPGTLHGACAMTSDRLAAQCSVGRGKATIVADADLLNVAKTDAPNLDAVLEELAMLESK
jgi:hypothetical protein